MDTKPRKSRSVHFLSEPELIRQIEERANEQDRSLAAEIRHALRQALEEQRR